VNILRRLPLSRLLLLCGLVVAIGASATALASALDTGPKPAAKPLAEAVHDALAGPSVNGVSARIKLTNNLLEGANLAGASGGEISSSPLLQGGSGRLWSSSDGRLRIELQTEKGDTQILYDGHTVSIYDAASNKLYTYTPRRSDRTATDGGQDTPGDHEPPSIAKVEEGIARLREHADVSEATPADVGGQAAYTVRVSPKESGSLIGGAELSFDAAHGIPLRLALYSSKSSAPVIELAATEVNYGPIDASVFEFSPPPSAQVQKLDSTSGEGSGSTQKDSEHATFNHHGEGVTSIGVLEQPVKSGSSSTEEPSSNLPQVDINGTKANELRTELGTILTFERSGVRYVLAGAVEPSAVEALARGL
jgi:outer membrane lipoprotein-sorting protein